MRLHTNVRSGLLLFAAVAAASAQLNAQISAAADVGGVVQRTGVDLWRSTTRANPAFRVDGRWFQAAAEADVWGGANALHLQRGAADVLAAPIPFGPVRLTAVAHMERLATSPALERTVSTIESAASLRLRDGGGWLGAALERAREVDNGSVRPLLRAGLWQRFGMMSLSLSAESHRARLGGRPPTIHSRPSLPDSSLDSLTGAWIQNQPRMIVSIDSGSPSRLWQWSDVQARIGWTAGRVSLDGRVGVQPRVDATPRSPWARGVATVALAPRLALIAGAGIQPATVWLGTPSSRFVSIGLRVAPVSLAHAAPPPFVRPSAASFVIRRVDGDSAGTSYVVAVRVPDARAVEISGDFNGWHAVALREVRPDVWETVLVLRAGAHRVNVRVNGDSWVAPPGLPTADDDFNGTVGLIVVP